MALVTINPWTEEDGYDEAVVSLHAMNGSTHPTYRLRVVKGGDGRFTPCIRRYEGTGVMLAEGSSMANRESAKKEVVGLLKRCVETVLMQIKESMEK